MPPAYYPEHIDYARQGIETPGTRRDGQTGIWKGGKPANASHSADNDHACAGIFDPADLKDSKEPQDLSRLLDDSASRYPQRVLFQRRSLHPSSTPSTLVYSNSIIETTYAEVQSRRDAFGSGLLALEREGQLTSSTSLEASPVEIKHTGVPFYGDDNRKKGRARRGWAVGLWSGNREEWQVVDQACQAYGLVAVALYATLGPQVARYITNHCPLSLIVASGDHLPALLKIAPHCPTLRVIVTMDAFPPSEWEIIQQWAHSINIKLYTFNDVEARGRADLLSPGPEPGEEDISKNRVVAISYTSGTTGDPKGVVITSSNLLYATLSIAAGYSDRLKGIHWKLLSFLPLGHIYERVLESVALYYGATIAFSQCDPAKFLEDAQFFKPHMLPGVPRMWNRISSAITDQMKAPGLKGALLRKAVATKLADWEETGQVTHTVYDALVFRKIKALAGGEVIFMTTGSAPLRPDVHALLKVCFCADFVQGVIPSKPDLTTFVHSIPNDKTSLGTCGFLASCNEAKLVDVPDMNYHATDQPNPRGELCMRGYNVSPGYLHNEKATAEAIDDEGWFHTGDIGEFDACGRLKIIDRLKNVIKLSQGQYVALEKLEGLYASNPLFASLLVHGDSTRSHLIALAVLDPEQASKLVWKVLKKGVRAEDVKQLEMAVKENEVRKVVLRQLAKVAAKNGLNGFEMIKGLHLTVRPFPDEILTPTFKVKRNIAAKVFRDVIEEVYSRGEGEVKEPLAPLPRVSRG
ncbi:long-chain acyl-CoA synthetase [Cryptococcus wingfieldii CBS 7118]|uniref:Long-chain acyl-CoA synthetase n=1 Tax=Cryptococcus wingfieldii CBS 7118 TaxID=1295528 RepID=A0A1E3K739_9TREE|nr:long-chain acyl-CoA synthetase [Cryptococcus wingfieldii CBS 7118]ODO08881.1 long-chain acyl-CoA synthetase [Cryptococcus wingfieldii CBS 7118]